jgi:hypothetical protein
VIKPATLQILAAAILLTCCSFAASAQKAGGQKFDAAAIEREIKAFYDEYAVELRESRGPAIAARYDPRGSWVLGNGRKSFQTAAQTNDKYTKFTAPKIFAWKELSIDVLSPDVVSVLGLFDWGMTTAPAVTYSYTGVLVRRDGKWRIRIEDESRGIPAPKPTPAQ